MPLPGDLGYQGYNTSLDRNSDYNTTLTDWREELIQIKNQMANTWMQVQKFDKWVPGQQATLYLPEIPWNCILVSLEAQFSGNRPNLINMYLGGMNASAVVFAGGPTPIPSNNINADFSFGGVKTPYVIPCAENYNAVITFQSDPANDVFNPISGAIWIMNIWQRKRGFTLVDTGS